MARFRILLAALFLIIATYTVLVFVDHGANLVPIFLGDIARFNWRGQFNLDFLCFLVLSALWLCWRHGFNASGWVLAVCGLFGGALFLSAYLFYHSYRVNDDWATLLLGAHNKQS